MPTHPLTPTGETLGDLLERVAFSDPDPRVQRLKEQWEQTKAEVQQLFESACREQHEGRLKYHRGCGASDADARALRDLALIRPMLIEEREQRLCLLWQGIYRKVGMVLEEASVAED